MFFKAEINNFIKKIDRSYFFAKAAKKFEMRWNSVFDDWCFDPEMKLTLMRHLMAIDQVYGLSAAYWSHQRHEQVLFSRICDLLVTWPTSFLNTHGLGYCLWPRVSNKPFKSGFTSVTFISRVCQLCVTFKFQFQIQSVHKMWRWNHDQLLAHLHEDFRKATNFKVTDCLFKTFCWFSIFS